MAPHQICFFNFRILLPLPELRMLPIAWNIQDSPTFKTLAFRGITLFHSYRDKRDKRQWRPTPALLPGKSHGRRSLAGYSPWGRLEWNMTERLHFHFHALAKDMATHSSALAWSIPGMGEPGGLPSMGSHRVGHNWRDFTAAAAEIKGYITENNACLVRGLPGNYDLTYVDSCENKGFQYQEVYNTK